MKKCRVCKHTKDYESFEKSKSCKDGYARDNFACQACGDDTGGNLIAHHIYNYSEHKNLQTEITNGITFCVDCHIRFHKLYGYTNNNKKQLQNFLK